MVDYREILRLRSLGHSQRNIARGGTASRSKIGEVFEAADNYGIDWPLDEDVTNADLKEILFPSHITKEGNLKAEPDYVYIHKELARPGVTLTLLWDEYCANCYENGKTPYMSTQFGDKYRKWAKLTKATMRIAHKPGEAMQVDWAGNTIPIYDSVSGEEFAAYVFVAVLPCSCYAYAEVCADMKTENWLLCHIHAYQYFGGVTRLLIPDNLKTGVQSNTRYSTILNRSYQEMSAHYGTAIVPTRVRKPKDKALVEGTVRFVSTWIIAALRNQKFFSVAAAQEAVANKLDELNSRPFQKRDGSRRSAYLEEEKDFMQPLPVTDYEPAVWSTGMVGYDYLVTDGRNKYSVPFDLIGEKVDIRLTKNILEVFYHGNRVASHVRKAAIQRDPVVKTEHMPSEHRKYLLYNSDDFMKWASGIGTRTTEVVRHFLSAGKAPEQGYKSCVSLTKLAEKYGAKKLENTCERVLAYSSTPSIRNVSTILKNGQDKNSSKAGVVAEVSSDSHGITRGADYFSKGGNRND